MRRIFSAILLLFVFLSLQFGKVANYLYCKWQSEIVLNKTDCGCDDHLTTMFSHEDSANNNMTKINLNEKLSEFNPKPVIEYFQIPSFERPDFIRYNEKLSESFIPAPFHPPIV